MADELLIQPKAGVPHEKVKETLEAFGAVTEEEIPQIRVKRIKVPPQALEKVKDALSRHPHINFVEPNFLAEPTFTPNDSYYLIRMAPAKNFRSAGMGHKRRVK